MPTPFLALIVILVIVGMAILGWKLANKLNPFGDHRNFEESCKGFMNYDWVKLKNAFNETHADLDADRLDRAFTVYYRVMSLAYDWNQWRSLKDPHVSRAAPFDKDVDTFWRFHAEQPDYDVWCEVAFGGKLRPRSETYEEPTWKTREERQKTKVAYKRKYKLQDKDADTNNDDFIPPIIVV